MDWLAYFQLSLEAADPKTLAALFADEVTLHTLAVSRQSYTSKALVAQTLGMALAVLAPIQVTDALRHYAAHSAAVVFTAQVAEAPPPGDLVSHRAR